MWVASDGGVSLDDKTQRVIEVRYSDFPYSMWSGPVTIAAGIKPDDICVITAMPGGKIAIMWSNQNTERFGFRVHLDGLEEHHDRAVSQKGVFKHAVSAIHAAKAKGFRVNVNCTLFDQMNAREAADYFDFVTGDLGVEGITVSPGYAYERAPDQEHFLNRIKTKQLFRDIFKLQEKYKWRFSQSVL